jgi:hypothetical protein
LALAELLLHLQVCVASAEGTEVEEFLQQIPIKMAEAPWFYNGTLEGRKMVNLIAVFRCKIAVICTGYKHEGINCMDYMQPSRMSYLDNHDVIDVEI